MSVLYYSIKGKGGKYLSNNIPDENGNVFLIDASSSNVKKEPFFIHKSKITLWNGPGVIQLRGRRY
jgi:hypothetical protein